MTNITDCKLIKKPSSLHIFVFSRFITRTCGHEESDTSHIIYDYLTICITEASPRIRNAEESV